MSLEELQLSDALWALKRIARKPSAIQHGKMPSWWRGQLPDDDAPGWTLDGQTCDCCQCIAKDALGRIKQRLVGVKA